MRKLLCIVLGLTLLPALADQRIGKWCEPSDDGKSCVGYISYFPNGDVYAYGLIEEVLYIATGFWQQNADQSCLNLTYKAFDFKTEEPLPTEEDNFCNTVLEITEGQFTYLSGEAQPTTMRRISNTPDRAMLPMPEEMLRQQNSVKPIPLTINAKPGNYGVFTLPLEAAPNKVKFTLSFTPNISADASQNMPYAYVQLGEAEDTHLRISLHYKREYGNTSRLMLEYLQPGMPTQRQLLSKQIEHAKPLDIEIAWTEDGETAVTYNSNTVQHVLPLSSWQSYFIVSAAKATFQRKP